LLRSDLQRHVSPKFASQFIRGEFEVRLSGNVTGGGLLTINTMGNLIRRVAKEQDADVVSGLPVRGA